MTKKAGVLVFLLQQENKSLVVTLYHVVGRASEVDLLVWELVYWDTDRHVNGSKYFTWTRAQLPQGLPTTN